MGNTITETITETTTKAKSIFVDPWFIFGFGIATWVFLLLVILDFAGALGVNAHNTTTGALSWTNFWGITLWVATILGFAFVTLLVIGAIIELYEEPK